MPRKDELEAEQRMLEKRLEKLKLQQQSCSEPNCSEQFEREARGLQKKIVNAKMRLRSIKIKSLEKGRVSPQASFNSYPVKKSMSDDVNLTEIDANDEEFDPTQYNFVHERPVTRLLPDIPLPHSSLLWEKTRYVAKWIHTLDAESLLSGKIHGQFQSVEDEIPSPCPTNKTFESFQKPIGKYSVESAEAPSDKNRSEFSDCICGRPEVSIICEAGCGFSVTGRLASVCKTHTNLEHLMDIDPVCPRCHGVLVELINISDVKPEPNNNDVKSYLAPDFKVVKPKLIRKKK